MRKRDRLNELLERLDKEIGGENSMEEKDFDVEEYIQALEQFKSTHRDEIVKQLGSMESFEAVSYTHLDVYKRQRLSLLKRGQLL